MTRQEYADEIALPLYQARRDMPADERIVGIPEFDSHLDGCLAEVAGALNPDTGEPATEEEIAQHEIDLDAHIILDAACRLKEMWASGQPFSMGTLLSLSATISILEGFKDQPKDNIVDLRSYQRRVPDEVA